MTLARRHFETFPPLSTKQASLPESPSNCISLPLRAIRTTFLPFGLGLPRIRTSHRVDEFEGERS